MTNKKLFFSLMLIFASTFSYSQPAILWDETYGGSSRDGGMEMLKIDGGFIVASRTSSGDFDVIAGTDPDGSGNHLPGAEEFWIKKIDNNGNIIWQNPIGGLGGEQATCIDTTNDGGYIIAGFMGGVFNAALPNSFDLATPADVDGNKGFGQSDIWVVKVDANGLIVWQNQIGGSGFDFAFDVKSTTDGGYLLTGHTGSNDFDALAANEVDGTGFHGGTADIWAIKLSATGNILWNNIIGGSSFDYGAGSIEVNDGYIVAGTSISGDGDLALPDVDGTPAHGQYDFYIAKLNKATGVMIWDNAIGGSGRDYLGASPGIMKTSDGNILLTGRTNSTNGDASIGTDADGSTWHGGEDMWAVKVDLNGQVIWHNAIGTNTWDEVKSAHIACDGKIILSGHTSLVGIGGDKTRVSPNGGRAPWLVKLDNNGLMEWDYPFSSAGTVANHDGPNHGFSYGHDADYYVLIDSLGGDYYVLTASLNPAGGDKTSGIHGPTSTTNYDTWLIKLGFDVTADFFADTVCLGTPTSFTNTSITTNPKPFPNYYWNFDDPPSGSADTSYLEHPTHVFTSAGTYDVELIIEYECKYDTIVKTVVVYEVTASISSQNNVLCNGDCDGDATVTASGGTSPYTYAWSNAQTTAIATGLCAGTYTVTVTDLNGCTSVENVTITEPTLLTTSISSQTNVLCNGDCTGDGTVTANGGTSPYTYLWSNAQTTQTSTGLCEGTYTITVTDNNGCTSTATVTITEPTPIDLTNISSTNSTCGNTDGTATVTPSGGTPGYTYNWSSGGTASTETNLTAGTYDVTVTDNNGCTAVTSVTVNSTNGPTANISNQTDVLCNGDCDGDGIVTATGGTSPYTYVWSNTQTTQTSTGLCVGTYTVTVTDNNGCTATTTVTITEPTAIDLSNTSSTNANCGNADGSATVTPSGGTPGYTYAWSSGGTASTETNIAAGTYDVTVTDNNGCTAVTTVTVNDTPGGTASSAINNQVLCNGDCDGSATINMAGGTSPFTYNWSNGTTTQTDNGLCAGTYDITVTDDNGCTSVTTVTITEPTVINLTNTSSTNATCGNTDGSATVTPSGGTPGYTFAWSSGGTASTETNLAAGTYDVTVTDNNGCTAVTSVTVNSTNGPTASISNQTNILCNGDCDGDATAQAIGGASPYTYIWNNAQTTVTATGLCAGSYTVTITDNNGCTSTATTTITEPTPIDLTNTSNTDETCGNVDGTATVTPSGGTPGYTYNWSSGGTANTETNLAAGNYDVTVTDANGCTAITTVIVNGTIAGTASITAQTNTSCNGGCDGDATADITTGAVNYQWDANANNQTTPTATGLCAGTYDVTVTDGNGCTDVATVTITEPTAIDLSNTNATNSNCGQADGDATVTPTGGTPGYTYQWDANANNQTTPTATGLTSGSYDVTVTDNNGCTAVTSIIVNDNNGGTANTTVTSNYNGEDVSCNGSCDGEAQVTMNGGTSPFTYNWSNAQTTQTSTGLCAGTYTVTVTDDNGCSSVSTVTLTEPTVIDLTNITSTTANCGNADGDATVTPSGGTPGYTYQWDANANNQTTPTATGLAGGNYDVTVTDNNGCTAITTVTVGNAAGGTAIITAQTNTTCNGSCDGASTASMNGGTAPYTYQWDANANNQITQIATGLCAGTYTVMVTDDNGCTDETTVTITEPSPINISTTINSDYNGFNISCFNFNDGEAEAVANGGTPGYTYVWSNANNTAINSNLTANTYTVTVTDNNGCTAEGTVILTEPTDLSAVIDSIASATCFGTNTGAAYGSGNGGVPSYTYNWNIDVGNDTTDHINNQYAGDYWFVIQDANGCIDSALASITQPEELQASITPLGTTCKGDCDGMADLTVTGGTPAYTYNWTSNGNAISTVEDLFNICPETYNVTVTDNNNCTVTATTEIIILNPDPVADFTADPEETTIRNTEIEFTDESQGAVNQWSWTMWNNDSTEILNTTTIQHPTYEYPQVLGTYPVHLMVISQAGCVHDTVKYITIDGEFGIYVPNAFTPNGDGLNDTFFPHLMGADEENYTLHIFDRWGEIIFTSTHPNNHWDGTAKAKGGTEIVEGAVYVYKIQVQELQNQNKHQLVGTVTLVK